MLFAPLSLALLCVGSAFAAIPLPRQRPAVTPSAASFYVSNIPSFNPDPTRPLHIFAGNLVSDPDAKPAPSKEVSAHIYFVLTKARRMADRERLIIWFNGGPGCSSFDGLMMEVGPWRMDGKDSLKQLDGGWEEYANVLYVDQPPGTGFSYTSTDKYVHELDEASNHLIEFLKNWYQVFPEFQGMDTYLAGESFAGQYIPYFADAITKTTLIKTPLKGIAIGNGWIDPVTQYPAYVEFAVKEKLLKEGTKEYTKVQGMLDECQKQLNASKILTPHFGDCEGLMSATVEHLEQSLNGKTTCMNVYDVRLSDTFPQCGMNWPSDLSYIKPYLGRDDVRRALHGEAHAEAWIECHPAVGRNLYNNKSPASVTLLPTILEKMPVMLFSGDQDFICNHLGTERMIESIEWNGAKGFTPSLKPSPWKVNGTDAGEWTTERNLTYVKVFGASHMVGYDVPHVAHDMMLRFMGVDFRTITEGTARIPSSVGDNAKPQFNSTPVQNDDKNAAKPPVAPPADDTAMWQAYYNAGSAALVLVLIALAIGIFFYVRARRRSRADSGVALSKDDEESIPLSRSVGNYERVDDDEERRSIKGKGRAVDPPSPASPIFNVGDSDDEDDDRRHR